MKVKITQNALLKAITKGALAALSKEAQSDTTNLRRIIQSFKLTVTDSEFTVQSNTSLLASKYTVPVNDESGVVVKEGGEFIIQAKDVFDWVDAQSVKGDDVVVEMSFTAHKNPKLMNSSDDENEEAHGLMLKELGKIKFTSKDSSNSKATWRIACLDSEPMPLINYGERGGNCYVVNSTDFSEALKRLSIAVIPDYEHVLDSVSIQNYKDELFFASTDTKRCALYKFLGDGISSLSFESPMLIQFNLLDQVSKSVEERTSLSMSYNEDSNKAFIEQDNFTIRIACCTNESSMKFPNIQKLLGKKYKIICEGPKLSYESAIRNAATVNKSSGAFIFDGDKDTLSLEARSKLGPEPTTKMIYLDKVNETGKFVWGVSHMQDAMKTIKSNRISLHIPETDKGSVKVTGDEDDSFIYFAMSINEPIYQDA
jgi:DNA polymerase III sliding clamp (beta) subunit (PCNA family)